MLALLPFLCLGCQVVVLGDSNTCMWVERAVCLSGDGHSWPLRATKRPDWPRWRMVNRALPSMTAGDYGPTVRLTNGEPAYGGWHLERLIREDLADACTAIEARLGPLVIRRKLVIALGTNDVIQPQVTAIEAGMAVRALYERARRVPCVEVYVATIPPRRRLDAMKIRQANAVIQMSVPADHIIPFATQPESDLDETGVHMTGEGQDRRAALALKTLFPAP